jgi:hypothetical protein
MGYATIAATTPRQHGALGFAEGTNENRPRRLTGLPGAVEIVSCGMDVTVVRVRE